ncbi:unnamed protein product, partial [Phaeothamnion confervicola]
MDQNKTRTPYMGKAPCGWQHLTISQKLMGFIGHSHGGNEVYIFRLFENTKHGTNMAIEVLLLQFLATRESLPRMLYLQVDGGSENRSQGFMQFLTLLVSWGIFDEIIHTRLPVGHTHEDIDQVFSRISRAIFHGRLDILAPSVNALKAAGIRNDLVDMIRCR